MEWQFQTTITRLFYAFYNFFFNGIFQGKRYCHLTIAEIALCLVELTEIDFFPLAASENPLFIFFAKENGFCCLSVPKISTYAFHFTLTIPS